LWNGTALVIAKNSAFVIAKNSAFVIAKNSAFVMLNEVKHPCTGFLAGDWNDRQSVYGLRARRRNPLFRDDRGV